MIQLVKKRRKCTFDISEINDPSAFAPYRAGHMNLDAEGMPVQPSALVPLRNVGQPVGGFETSVMSMLVGAPQLATILMGPLKGMFVGVAL